MRADECWLFRPPALAAADWLGATRLIICSGGPGVEFWWRLLSLAAAAWLLVSYSTLAHGAAVFHRSALNRLPAQRALYLGSVLAVYDYSLQRRADWTTASVAADQCSVQRSSCGAGSYRAPVLVGHWISCACPQEKNGRACPAPRRDAGVRGREHRRSKQIKKSHSGRRQHA